MRLDEDRIAAQAGALISSMEELAKESSLKDESEHKILGLKYEPGEVVTDARTGRRYKIIAGQRATFTVQVPGPEAG